jgi:hypothetical protein
LIGMKRGSVGSHAHLGFAAGQPCCSQTGKPGGWNYYLDYASLQSELNRTTDVVGAFVHPAEPGLVIPVAKFG